MTESDLGGLIRRYLFGLLSRLFISGSGRLWPYYYSKLFRFRAKRRKTMLRSLSIAGLGLTLLSMSAAAQPAPPPSENAGQDASQYRQADMSCRRTAAAQTGYGASDQSGAPAADAQQHYAAAYYACMEQASGASRPPAPGGYAYGSPPPPYGYGPYPYPYPYYYPPYYGPYFGPYYGPAVTFGFGFGGYRGGFHGGGRR
jgi:hypothetical protein